MKRSIAIGGVVPTATPVRDELIYHIYERTMPAAFSLLPGRMTSIEAVGEMLAIGLQESEFNARRQGGRGTRPGNGPARGFWQFERMGGVAEVLSHPVTGPIIQPIARMFLFEPTPAACHVAIENHDVLAACFARLLLFIDPRALPRRDQRLLGWNIYLANWRPGKPYPKHWQANWERAWSTIEATT